ncbi:MAG: hypothetical protein LBI39_00690 [Puniceicoccales bacterium]|jgi:hypothetical protein|nr:hypothetical protein [Puniceicoccales bacterium]
MGSVNSFSGGVSTLFTELGMATFVHADDAREAYQLFRQNKLSFGDFVYRLISNLPFLATKKAFIGKDSNFTMAKMRLMTGLLSAKNKGDRTLDGDRAEIIACALDCMMEICPADKKDSLKKSVLAEISKITVTGGKQPDFLKYCLSCEDQQARKFAKYMLRENSA